MFLLLKYVGNRSFDICYIRACLKSHSRKVGCKHALERICIPGGWIMRRENEKLIIDGNAIYELDLECVRRKNQQKDKENEENQRKKNGRMPGRRQ